MSVLAITVVRRTERDDQRRTERRDAWRQHIAAERAPEATYQRIVSHGRNRGVSDDGYGLDARGNLKRFVSV
jgi:hypothetical protein